MKEFLRIVDLSAVFRRCWHASENEEVSQARTKTHSIVNSCGGPLDTLIALDTPPYNRKKLWPDYKGNRPKVDKTLIAQFDDLKEDLLKDGYTLARSKGQEADDVIATIKKQNPEIQIYGSDKDLLQLGEIIGPFSKNVKTSLDLGVKQDQVIDYLVMIGDTADNIQGIKGIGKKTAQDLLAAFGTLKNVYSLHESDETLLSESQSKAFDEFKSFWPIAEKLITLNSDCELEFIKKEDQRNLKPEEISKEFYDTPLGVAYAPETFEADFVEEGWTEETKQVEVREPEQQRSIVKSSSKAIEFSKAFEPNSIDEAVHLAKIINESALYKTKFGRPEEIAVVIMKGRVLGIDAITALDSIEMIMNKPTLSGELIIGLVLASGKAKYFMCTERTKDRCTWKTWRIGAPCEQVLTFTKEEMTEAKFCMGKDRYTGKYGVKDSWQKQWATMQMYRTASALARMVYPDVTKKIYTPDELEGI